MAGLNIRQRKFCRAYLINKGNQKKALGIAGYTVTNSNAARQRVHQLFQITEVREYYNGLVKRMEEKEGITLDYLFKKLKRAVDVCIPDEPDSDSPDSEVKKTLINNTLRESASSGIKAISEINKMQGNYAPVKSDNNNNNNNNTKVEIEDIERIFADLCKQNEKQF